MNRQPPRKTGSRPVCNACIASEAIANRFEGLPCGTSRWALVALVRQSAGHFGLSAREMTFIEDLVADTYDVDWTAGSEPVVFTPVYELAERQGVSERQIRNIERALVEKNLLCWRDSGNHVRKGKRDKTGRIVYAYGVSLAPMAARAAEIREAAIQSQQEASERRQARHRIHALRRRVRQLGQMVPPAAERMAAGIALSTMHEIIDQLTTIIHGCSDPQENVDTSAQAEIRTATYDSRAIKKTASGHGNLKIGKNGVAPPGAKISGVNEILQLLESKGGLRTQLYCSASSLASLRDIVDRTVEIARELNIPVDRWFEAISRLGIRDAVVLLCELDRRSPIDSTPMQNAIRCPTAYLTYHLRHGGLEQMRPRKFGDKGSTMAVPKGTVGRSELCLRISNAGQ